MGMITGQMRVNRVLVQVGWRERDSVNEVNESHGSGSSKLLCGTTNSEARVTARPPGRHACPNLARQNASGCSDIPPKSNQRSAFSSGCLDAFTVICDLSASSRTLRLGVIPQAL